MKKLILLILIGFSGTIFCQDAKIKAIEISEEKEDGSKKEVYCTVIGHERMMSSKITITVDFGQRMKFFDENRMIDPETGKPKIFNSMVDAINYMAEDGWKLHSTMLYPSSSILVYYYIMKKESE